MAHGWEIRNDGHGDNLRIQFIPKVYYFSVIWHLFLWYVKLIYKYLKSASIIFFATVHTNASVRFLLTTIMQAQEVPSIMFALSPCPYLRTELSSMSPTRCLVFYHFMKSVRIRYNCKLVANLLVTVALLKHWCRCWSRRRIIASLLWKI